VASTLIGPAAFTGGARTVALGITMHVGVAFGWSAVFIFLVLRSARVQAILASPYGVLKVAAVYGPAIWLVMSLAVIPLLLHRPPALTFAGWCSWWDISRSSACRLWRRRAGVAAVYEFRSRPGHRSSGAYARNDPGAARRAE